MANESRALVPLTGTNAQNGGTFFELFVARVSMLLGTDVGRTLGTVHEWRSAAPVADMLSAGLWPVMLYAARCADTKLVTSERVAKIAGRVDRVINLGLAVCYSSVEEAAHAFVEVVRDAERTFAQSRLGAIPVSALWQRPVGRFFADLVKDLEQRAQQLTAIAEELIESAVRDEARQIEYIDMEKVHQLLSACALANLANTTVLRIEELRKVADYLRRGERLLEDARQMIDVLRRLPTRCNHLPDTEDDLGSSIEEQWLNTQVLLAAGDLPDAEYVKGRDFLALAGRILPQAADDTVLRFFERMERRGMRPLPSQARVCLERLVRDAYDFLCRKKPVINSTVQSWLYISAAVEDLRLEPSYALGVALGESVAMVEVFGNEQWLNQGRQFSDDELNWLRTFVADAISWSTVTSIEIRTMFKDGPLPPELIVGGMSLMPLEERRKAVERVLLADMAGDRAQGLVALLFAHDCVDDRSAILLGFEPFIPVHELGPCVRAVLLADTETGMSRDETDIVLNAMLRMDRMTLCEMLEEPDVRMAVVREIVGEVTVVVGGTQSKRTKQFAELFGKEVWHLLLLAYEVLLRKEEYARGPFQGDAGVFMPRWDESLAPQLEEEGAHRWLYLGDPESEQKWETYARSRDEYYRLLAEEEDSKG